MQSSSQFNSLIIITKIGKSRGLKRWQSMMAKFQQKYGLGEWDHIQTKVIKEA
jgi:hypothetical protein